MLYLYHTWLSPTNYKKIVDLFFSFFRENSVVDWTTNQIDHSVKINEKSQSGGSKKKEKK